MSNTNDISKLIIAPLTAILIVLWMDFFKWNNKSNNDYNDYDYDYDYDK